MRARLLAAALVLLAPPAVHAEGNPAAGAAWNNDALTAVELRDMCASSSDLDYGFCAGYVSGIADSMRKNGTACNLTRVRSQQLVDTFNQWVQMFPDQVQGGADAAAAASVARAFPCR